VRKVSLHRDLPLAALDEIRQVVWSNILGGERSTKCCENYHGDEKSCHWHAFLRGKLRISNAKGRFQYAPDGDAQPCAQPDGPVRGFSLASIGAARRLA
jgi:hypothetical protein